MRLLNVLLIIGIITLGLTSCYYDNAEELYPQPVECDTINVTYYQTIAPIMTTNCDACHSGAAPPANVITDNYTNLKNIAEDGRLWGTINHDAGYSPMPKDRPKMNECDLKKINIWLENGALND